MQFLVVASAKLKKKEQVKIIKKHKPPNNSRTSSCFWEINGLFTGETFYNNFGKKLFQFFTGEKHIQI